MDNPDGQLDRRDFLTVGGVATLSLLSPATTHARAPRTPSKSVQDGYSQEQYKRRALRAMALIDEGKHDEAIEHVRQHLEEIPGDPELLFCLAVAHSQNGNLDAALDATRKAVNQGLPAGRFLAGPRELLAPLMESDAAREFISRRHDDEYVHGPLLGAVTDTTAQVWVRTVGEASVQVLVEPEAPDDVVYRSDVVQARVDGDYTAVVRIEGLSPNTTYSYRLVVNDHEQPDSWSFRTFPADGEPAAFDIGFGACAGYTPWRERIWRRIASHSFPVILLLGDNVYIDHPERPNLQRYCYYRRQSRPEFRTLTAESSVAAIWDDHDFGDNDSEGGPEPFEPEWKVEAWQIFRENWNNAEYGGGEEQPGVWHEMSIADVDIFLLDGRYYRTNEDADSPTMLGATQKEWLFDGLRRSTATFKLIASPVPFPDGAKPGEWAWRSDPWEGYPDEREELFSFIEEEEVEGVVLLAGDRHRADVWKIERDEGYDLYEFVNGRLTNIHTHDPVEGALYSYNEKPHFGRLRFDTTKADPTLTYDIINITGEVVHSTTLTRSQLTHA